jgi:hypothetical protein
MKSKEEFLLYKNPAVVERYMKECNANEEEANLIWLELIKYLYIAAYCNHNKIAIELPFFDQVNNKIDEMWHRFLLFTKDYREFCNCYCGVFLDHVPESDLDDSRSLKNPDYYQKTKENLKNYLRLVYEIWGMETFENWVIKKIYK